MGKYETGEVIIVDKNDSKVSNAKDLVAIVDHNGCWNVTSHCLDSGGYGQYRKQRTHVFAYKKFVGEILKGQVVRHKCDNPKCCNPDHLEIGTQKDNVDDRERRNRGNQKQKLTTEEVIEIAKSELTESKIAEIYGICRQTVNDIKNRRRRQKVLNGIEIVRCEKKLLAKDDVLEIFISNEKIGDIATKFSISKATVHDIKSKRRHKKYLEGVNI